MTLLYIQTKRERSVMKKKKPITVLDAEQKKIGTTYSHRAQGLVMKGRARFIDENTIILDDKEVPPCPLDININLEDKMMKELAIDTNEIVENGFGEIVETGKNVEAEEIAVENVEETVGVADDETEVCENVTEAEILDELNELLEDISDSSLNMDSYKAMTDSVVNLMITNGVTESVLHSLSATIEEITTAYHNTLRKLIEAYNVLLERIKSNRECGLDNTAETGLFNKLKNLRGKVARNNAVRNAYAAIVSTSLSVYKSDTGLSVVDVFSEAFYTISNNNMIFCETINKLLDVYVSMLK